MLKKVILISSSIVLITIITFILVQKYFIHTFEQDVQILLSKTQLKNEMIRESDLAKLPEIVQLYLRKTNVINSSRVINFRADLNGELRQKGEEFFPFKGIQYNFFDQYSRLFYFQAVTKRMIILGYHRYVDQLASMSIKLFGVIPVASADGPEFSKAETVTLFSEMCIMAPGTLIDKRISWKILNDTQVEAIFKNGDLQVKSKLTFDPSGLLIKFESDDRIDINTKKYLHFTILVDRYESLGKYLLAKEVSANYLYDDGPFIYGKFRINKIDYNIKH